MESLSDVERQARRAIWRAKREARRAKQRIANIDRAKAMHAARIAAERDGCAGLAQHDPAKRPAPHIGCSGWYYWHWKGQFYPEGLASSRWFRHYASKFNTVELNAPFYSWPTLGNVNT